MFLQDGHNPPDVFLQRGQTKSLSEYVTDILKRYNVHIVKLGHKAFYANYAYVFIDIDQLKGKPMQRTCNGFVLQMAHFYSIKSIVKKSLQNITK